MLRRLRDAKDELTDTEAHEALSEAAPRNGGGDPGRKVGEAFLEVRSLLGTLEEAGIVVRDIDRGLIDFPAIRDGEEVYLCWELGEDSVEHWHDLESGYGAGGSSIEQLLRTLTAHERLAAAGAAIVVASLFLPWYGVTLAGGLVKTAIGTFGWVEAACF